MYSFSLRLLILPLVLIQSLFGTEKTTSSLKVSLSAESDPTAFVGNVNAIFGNLLLVSHDLIYPGVAQLPFTRYYDSSRTEYLWLGAGMTSNYPFWIQGIPGEGDNWDHLLAEEDCGSVMTYVGCVDPYKKSSSKFYLSGDVIYGGLTNTGKEEISGRTNSKNTMYSAKIQFRDCVPEKCIWTGILPDGTEKEFYKDYGVGDILTLEEMRKPNGHKLFYKYKKKTGLLEEIKVMDEDKSHCLGKLTIDYETKKTTVTSIHGKKVTYSYSETLSGLNLVKKLPRIDEVDSPDQPRTKYVYSKVCSRPVISEIRRPNGSFLKIRYDKEGRVVEERAPQGQDGLETTIYRFEYDPEHFRTTVWDGLNRKTLYTYTWQKRLKSIRKYKGQNKLYRRLSFIWGSKKSLKIAKKDTSDEGNLLSKSIRDGKDLVASSHCYAYDDSGNIVKETLYGNLSGKGPNRFTIDDTGHPKSSSIESYTKRYTYSDDSFRLRLSESEDNGPTIKYIYKKGTDLLTAKLTHDGKSIIKREFYSYNKDAILVEHIVDDGSSNTPDDVRGVTQRHITKIIPTKKLAEYGMGQPKEIQEYYYDPYSKKEKLLGKREFEYTKEGLPKEEKVYDSSDTCRYTLYTSYNKNGLPVKKTDAIGREYLYSYDENFNKTREELKGSGFFTLYHYDRANRLIKEEERHSDGTNRTTSYTYDVVGNKTSSTDHFQNTTYYQYDDCNRLVSITLPSILLSDNTIHTPTLKKSYDIFDNIKKEVDSNGNVTTIQNTVRGKPYHILYPDGSSETFHYNMNGTLSCHILRDGSKIEYSYDIFDRIIQEKISDKSGHLLSKTRQKYNTFQKVSTIDPMGYVTKYAYDGAGRLIEEKKQVGDIVERTTYHYDALNRLQTTKHWQGDTSCILGIKKYDLLGQVIEQRSEASNGVLLSKKQYTYDLQGNVTHETVCVTSNESAVSTTYYNSQSLPIIFQDPLGNETKVSYNYEWRNSLGQKVLQKTTINPLQHKTVETFNALNQVVLVEKYSQENELLARVEYFYDANGNKVVEKQHSILNGSSIRDYTVHYTYTSMNHVASIIEEPNSPDKKKTSYSYTSNDLIQKIIKPDGVQLVHRYDGLSRLTHLTSSDGSIDYSHIYDNNGNIISTTDHKDGTVYTYAYDGWNRKIKDSLYNNLQTHLSYNTQGRLNQFTVLDKKIDYGYVNDRLVSVVRYDLSGKEFYRHSYTSFDLLGRVISSSLVGGLGEVHLSRDKLGRTISCSTPYWSESVPQDGFDKIGNLLKNDVKDIAGVMAYRYSYDKLNQVQQESGPFETKFEHDSLYNCHKKNDQLYQINGLNQLLSDSKNSCSYDKNGNLIKIQSDSSQLFMSYDALDRLIAVESPGEFRYEYVYDSSHRRLLKRDFEWDNLSHSWQKKHTTTFLYLHNREVGSVNSLGEIQEFRVLGLGSRAEIGASVAIELGSSISCPIHDHRGNIVTLVDVATKNVQEAYRYSAFGQEIILNGSGEQIDTSYINNPWRFTSKRYDQETGLVFFGRRYYSPHFGRFITQDPLGFQDGPNLYAYVKNQPLILIDPYGLSATENVKAASEGIRDGIKSSFLSHGEMWNRNCTSFCNFGANLVSGDFSSYRAAWNNTTTPELIRAGTQRAVEFGVMAFEVSSLSRVAYNAATWCAARAPILGNAALAFGQRTLDRARNFTSRFARSTPAQSISNNTPSGTSQTLVTRQQIAKEELLGTLEARVGQLKSKYDVNQLSRAGQILDRAGLTRAGRALDKHGNRLNSHFPKATGTPTNKNMQGQYELDNILTHPQSKSSFWRHRSLGEIIDIEIPHQGGARFSVNSDFIGFLEP